MSLESTYLRWERFSTFSILFLPKNISANCKLFSKFSIFRIRFAPNSNMVNSVNVSRFSIFDILFPAKNNLAMFQICVAFQPNEWQIDVWTRSLNLSSALKCRFTICSTPHRKLRVCNEKLLTHFWWFDPHKICCILLRIFNEIKFKF